MSCEGRTQAFLRSELRQGRAGCQGHTPSVPALLCSCRLSGCPEMPTWRVSSHNPSGPVWGCICVVFAVCTPPSLDGRFTGQTILFFKSATCPCFCVDLIIGKTSFTSQLPRPQTPTGKSPPDPLRPHSALCQASCEGLAA